MISDLPPTIAITQPNEQQVERALNGQLAVDATIGDDFGVA